MFMENIMENFDSFFGIIFAKYKKRKQLDTKTSLYIRIIPIVYVEFVLFLV